jgi:hypothetical protein
MEWSREDDGMVSDIGLGMDMVWSSLYCAQCWKGLGLVQGIEESMCDDLGKMV